MYFSPPGNFSQGLACRFHGGSTGQDSEVITPGQSLNPANMIRMLMGYRDCAQGRRIHPHRRKTSLHLHTRESGIDKNSGATTFNKN